MDVDNDAVTLLADLVTSSALQYQQDMALILKDQKFKVKEINKLELSFKAFVLVYE